MTYYIQKLHDENREDDLIDFMQEVFQDFEISYHNETKHAGYFTFQCNGKTVTEFISTSFFCHAFNMDDNLLKTGLEKQVNKAFRKFMASIFPNYLEEFKTATITKQNEHLLT